MKLFIALLLSFSTLALASPLLKLRTGTVDIATLSKQNSRQKIWSDSGKTKSPREDSDWIIQYKNPISDEERLALNKAAEMLGYLPDFAWIVHGKYADLEKLKQQNSNIYGIIALDPNLKISDGLIPVSVFNQDDILRVVVKVYKTEDTGWLVKEISNLDSKVVFLNSYDKYLYFLLPRKVLPRVMSYSLVESIEKDKNFSLHDVYETAAKPGDFSDLKGFESGTKIMNFDRAWGRGLSGEGQVVGIADTGLDTGDSQSIHLDFVGVVDMAYTFGIEATSWADFEGHGTRTAGILLGRGRISDGALRGGAYNAMLVAESLWSPKTKSINSWAPLTTVLDKAAERGAFVHSNSWGSAQDLNVYDLQASQLDQWNYNHPENLIVFSTGNSGVDLNKDGRIDGQSIESPATAKNVLSVGASENKVSKGGVQTPVKKQVDAAKFWPKEPIASSLISDNPNGLAYFSSRGPTKDGRIKPDVVAPGTNILALCSHTPGANHFSGNYNADFCWGSGTSASTPLVAAAATLLRQYLVEIRGMPHPSAALVKALLMQTSVDLYPGQYGKGKTQEILTPRPNNDEGYGRVDAGNIGDLSAETQLIDNATVAQGQQQEYPFTLQEARSLKANLVWTDYPGSVNAGAALVNDLDLSLVMPDGKIISPNDHVNNAEMIELKNLKPGDYKLIVRGYNIPQPKNNTQNYALVITLTE